MFDIRNKFPKRRKFRPIDGTPSNSEVREYTDYETNPATTYQIIQFADGSWGWEMLQHGWPVSSSGSNRQDSFELAYANLRDVVTQGNHSAAI